MVDSLVRMRPRIGLFASLSPRAPAPSRGLVEGSSRLMIVLPQVFFFGKTEGLSHAMFSLLDESWCSMSC
jgi:hypothetical protein